jgi:hypothetical protein
MQMEVVMQCQKGDHHQQTLNAGRQATPEAALERSQ